MKKKLIVTIISICLFSLFSGKSFSQSSSKGFMGSISGGVSIPFGDLDYYQSTGYEIGLKGGYKFNNNFISGLDVNYDYFSTDNFDSVLLSGGNANIISISAFLMTGNFQKNVKFNPYFLIGAGLYMEKTSSTVTSYGTVDASDYSSYFGMSVGAGVSYRASDKVSIFIEPKYAGTFTSYSRMFMSVKAGVAVGM